MALSATRELTLSCHDSLRVAGGEHACVAIETGLLHCNNQSLRQLRVIRRRIEGRYNELNLSLPHPLHHVYYSKALMYFSNKTTNSKFSMN